MLEKEILKPAAKAGADRWPAGCPLDPARDLWATHEKQKSRKRGSNNIWTCGICGKTFKTEHYLDLHMERKHMNYTPPAGVCLADYCEVFDACQHDPTKYRRRKELEELVCDNATMDKHRHNCEAAITKCFPLSEEAPRKLNAQFTRQFCRMIDCGIREQQRKEHHMELMPVVVILILIALVCFMVFSITVCCVDYSDDIFQFMVDSGIASSSFVKKLRQTRDNTRQNIGMDRTKCI